jgi:hypothetical protein
MKMVRFGCQFVVTGMTIFALSIEAYAVAANSRYSVGSSVKTQTSNKTTVTTTPARGDGKLILLNEGALKQLQNSKPEGPRSGGGGNSCALNINENTKQLLKTLELMPQLLTKKQLNDLKQHILKTAFYLKDNLYKNGESKDAINFPAENKIYVSPNLCKWQMVEVSGSAMAILLHEYLGLAGINDSKYQISGKFLAKYAEIVAIVPILKNSNVDEKLYRAVVYKFLREANTPHSKLAKKIASLKEASKDGRNSEGIISKQITAEDIQVVVTSSSDLGNLWESAERKKDYCIATSSSADYLIYLSSNSDIHSGSELTTIKFSASSKRNLYAKVLLKEETYCGELIDDSKKFSEPVEQTDVSDFELVE